MAADSIDALVEIGIIGRPHGVGGEIRIFLHNPSSAILEKSSSILLVSAKDKDTRAFEVSSIRQGNKCLLVKLRGVEKRDIAETLKGAKVCVRREALPPVAEDEFYVADLIGLEAWEGDTLLGRVTASRPQAGIEVVTVRGDREEIEIPLVDDFIIDINIAGGRIQVFDTAMLPRISVRNHRT